ncbi:hypothetical protein FPOA_11832 [Fusarium poae]|uniref:Uncharacterized protein n=1 Tax=Fusarium poae TaxID=36050 RepID=A0A1B8AI00_FUSPO|nr:hypothetical protein FPOA_11832 [Fusarium poae]
MNTLIRNKTTAVQAHALEDGRANPLKPGTKHSSEYFKILEDAEPVACCRQFEFPVNDGIAGGWVAAALSRVYALEGWKGESLSKLKATFNFQPAKDEPLRLDKDRICMESHGRKGYGFCAVRWKVEAQLDDRREGEAEAERGPEGECVLPSSSSSGW